VDGPGPVAIATVNLRERRSERSQERKAWRQTKGRQGMSEQAAVG